MFIGNEHDRRADDPRATATSAASAVHVAGGVGVVDRAEDLREDVEIVDRVPTSRTNGGDRGRQRTTTGGHDDVVWYLAGYTTLTGKAAYDAEIDNPEFVGQPTLNVERVIEEGDTIAVVGNGEATWKNGQPHRFAFSDVFVFTGDLISRRESYVVTLQAPEAD